MALVKSSNFLDCHFRNQQKERKREKKCGADPQLDDHREQKQTKKAH
jgi:hypothetical protein